MNGKASQRKGSAYELEIARDFGLAGFPLRRTPNSGGLHIKGDLKGLEGFAIECKRCERLHIWACLDQALRQASATEIPLLIFRRNRGSSFATLPLAGLLGLLVELRGGGR